MVAKYLTIDTIYNLTIQTVKILAQYLVILFILFLLWFTYAFKVTYSLKEPFLLNKYGHFSPFEVPNDAIKSNG